MQEPRPTPDDRFSFGLWTVGWPARDPFGADADQRERHVKRFREALEHGAALDQLAVEHLLGARS